MDADRRAAIREWLVTMGKSVVFLVGLVLVMAALVDLAVGGSFYRGGENLEETLKASPGLVLLIGLALAVPPLAFAFRDAVRAGRGDHGPGRAR